MIGNRLAEARLARRSSGGAWARPHRPRMAGEKTQNYWRSSAFRMQLAFTGTQFEGRNTMNIKLITGLAFAFGLAATPSLGATFSDYDSNGNGQISRDEFHGSIADLGVYPNWDTNDDGLLDKNEFGELGQDWDYTAWDADADGLVDADEFYDGYYASYDANEDGHWDDGEWDDAGEAGLFDW